MLYAARESTLNLNKFDVGKSLEGSLAVLVSSELILKKLS